MPSGNNYGRIALPGGFAHMDGFGPSESALAQFLYPFTWRDVSFIFDDFVGGQNQEAGVANFDESLWQDGNSANGTLFKCPDTQLAGGVLQGVTGANDTDTIAVWGMHTWLGDQNCGVEFRYKVNNIDTLQHEMGLAEPYADQKLTTIDDIDAPSFVSGTVDLALVGRDTAQTLTTMAFVTDGSTTNMNATKTDLGTRTPTNAVYQIVRVQLTQTAAAVAASSAFVFDNNGALQESAFHGSALASQIKGDVLLGPVFVAEAKTTSARTVDIDYIAVWQDRS